MKKTWMPTADRLSDWPSANVVVAGFGVSGFAAADALLLDTRQEHLVAASKAIAAAENWAAVARKTPNI